MNFLVAQMISCYNPFETKERNLIKIYSFEKGIHMKAISKMKSLILKYRHAWVLLYGLIYMPWFCYLEKRQTIHYLIHSPLDDYIPFVEYFIIPYLLWFVFLAVTGAYFFFNCASAFPENSWFTSAYTPRTFEWITLFLNR